MSSELSTGKTVFILAVVIGCFAVLWPKVFYPMFLSQASQSAVSQAPLWRNPSNVHHMTQLCYLLEEQRSASSISPAQERWSEDDCAEELKKLCGVRITEKVLEGFRLAKDKTNLTACLQRMFRLDPRTVSSAAPPPTKTRTYTPVKTPHPHVRPERPQHIHSDTVHPALREKGRAIPQRTIEKEARPGPMPGIRPPMGAGSHMVPPQTKGSGAMGIIMPIYTVGIVVFFVYTIMKVVFKKGSDEDKAPKLKDFHMDPEYRKYIFDEEYLDSSNNSHRAELRRQDREYSKQRRRQDAPAHPEAKIEDEQMDQLRRRLEETELAMERLMSQMGSVTDKLTAAKITEVLTQAQAQAKILKQEVGDVASEDDLTTSEAFTNTLSEDFSLPLALQRRLEELQVKDQYIKGTSQGTVDKLPSHEAGDSDEESTESAEVIRKVPLVISKETGVVTSILKYDVEATKVQQEKLKVTQELPKQEDKKAEEETKNEEEDNLPSDMAQRDAASEKDSSEASETGADVSELRSFADEGQPTAAPTAVQPMPIIEENTPEIKFQDHISEQSQEKYVVGSTQTSNGNEILPKSNVEHSTQTEAEKKLSVLNLQTAYQIDQEKESNDSQKINEILLDATLPIDTQLLVQGSQMGSKPAENLEMSCPEKDKPPCVVTSQVSLAFVGLEQSQASSPLTLIVPDMNKGSSGDFSSSSHGNIERNEPQNETETAKICSTIKETTSPPIMQESNKENNKSDVADIKPVTHKEEPEQNIQTNTKQEPSKELKHVTETDTTLQKKIPSDPPAADVEVPKSVGTAEKKAQPEESETEQEEAEESEEQSDVIEETLINVKASVAAAKNTVQQQESESEEEESEEQSENVKEISTNAKTVTSIKKTEPIKNVVKITQEESESEEESEEIEILPPKSKPSQSNTERTISTVTTDKKGEPVKKIVTVIKKTVYEDESEEESVEIPEPTTVVKPQPAAPTKKIIRVIRRIVYEDSDEEESEESEESVAKANVQQPTTVKNIASKENQQRAPETKTILKQEESEEEYEEESEEIEPCSIEAIPEHKQTIQKTLLEKAEEKGDSTKSSCTIPNHAKPDEDDLSVEIDLSKSLSASPAIKNVAETLALDSTRAALEKLSLIDKSNEEKCLQSSSVPSNTLEPTNKMEEKDRITPSETSEMKIVESTEMISAEVEEVSSKESSAKQTPDVQTKGEEHDLKNSDTLKCSHTEEIASHSVENPEKMSSENLTESIEFASLQKPVPEVSVEKGNEEILVENEKSCPNMEKENVEQKEMVLEVSTEEVNVEDIVEVQSAEDIIKECPVETESIECHVENTPVENTDKSSTENFFSPKVDEVDSEKLPTEAESAEFTSKECDAEVPAMESNSKDSSTECPVETSSNLPSKDCTVTSGDSLAEFGPSTMDSDGCKAEDEKPEVRTTDHEGKPLENK